jgi:phosphatidate cytidylyltransferase
MAANNLTLRILSALVLIPLVIGTIYVGGIFFDAFVIAAFVLSMIELRNMASRLSPRMLYVVVGGLYFLLSFSLFDLLRDGTNGLYLTFTLMIVIWASDTVAYISGRLIGGPKLAPAVSPNKTWAGMIGSMIGAAAAFSLLLLYPEKMPDLIAANVSAVPASPALLIFYGAILGVVGQMGDLLESWIKRKAGLKDSGKLIPGHGGVLDRIDALLLVIPVFYAICYFGL